ncbi:helix-turn-helix transcriptional regulator [Paraburkholderia sp. IMGN_8]|uniref:helix-turn-helix domain-containing protein n=1 Tax=Paraburkholderia sp. IMGN_8 TaxID=3136564 RepID=UPI00310191D6
MRQYFSPYRTFGSMGQHIAGCCNGARVLYEVWTKIPNRTLHIHTPEELEAELGRRLKTLRVHKNLDQAPVWARASISVSSLSKLENGGGSSLRTLIRVLRVLGRETWLETIAPVATINPEMMVPRQRASKLRLKRPDR